MDDLGPYLKNIVENHNNNSKNIVESWGHNLGRNSCWAVGAASGMYKAVMEDELTLLADLRDSG